MITDHAFVSSRVILAFALCASKLVYAHGANAGLPPKVSNDGQPIVFNATASAAPGDIVGLQGENFGADPVVYLEGFPTAPLAIVNRVAGHWLGVRIPARARGALVLRIANGNRVSAPIKLNAAKPMHLDALQLTAGGAFRLFGRNLRSPSGVPRVTVDGLAATIDLQRSDEYMLAAVAPAALRATSAAVVRVDNGTDKGWTPLDRAIEVVASPHGDPFRLGLGWAAAFSTVVRSTIRTADDSRLAARTVCDGRTDDTAAIAQAIDLAVSMGGAVVQLPAGRCRLAGSVSLRSAVVLQGAGKTSTEIVYEANYPIHAVNVDLAGLRNLTLSNSGAATEGMLLKDSTRVVLQNVRVRSGRSRQMFLTGNRQFAVEDCDFEQQAGIAEQGPYLLQGSAGLVFENNTTRWVAGAPGFGGIHDSYIHRNRFVRDARAQNEAGVVHGATFDFAYRVAVVGNSFEVADGPITNRARNDGETILSEGGGNNRTESLGTVSFATASTFGDTHNTLRIDPFGTGSIPENYGVAIVGGKGAGQTRRVVAYAGSSATVDRPWDVIPDTTSHYSTFVWGLDRVLFKDNRLSGNPRGIWLYNAAIRDVAIVGNKMAQGGGIYLRSYQNLAAKSFLPIYNVLIANNTVVNSTGQWMSYISSVFVNVDARDFGIATIGIEMRSNRITANRPNLSSSLEEYAGREGYLNMMRVETRADYEGSNVPHLLGSILTNNICTYCETAVRLGTGAGGTTIVDTPSRRIGARVADEATTTSAEKSTGTLVH